MLLQAPSELTSDSTVASSSISSVGTIECNCSNESISTTETTETESDQVPDVSVGELSRMRVDLAAQVRYYQIAHIINLFV